MDVLKMLSVKMNTKALSWIQFQLLVVILSFGLLIPDVLGSGCRRRMTRQVINYNDCLPKRLLTYSCVGTCVTHSQISLVNPLQLEHTCYQCKEAVITTRKVKLQCPTTDSDGSRRFEAVTIDVPVPRECMCEICNVDDAANVVNSHT